MAKKSLEEKIEVTKSVLKENLNTVRAGRANPALLDKVMVSYYGTMTPLKSLSNITTPDPRTLMVTPFDAGSINDIVHALNEANLGINPSSDGKVIRLAIPQLTEERRKELMKQVKKFGEDAKVAVRNIRRDENEDFKKQEKANEITEDDLKGLEDEIQKITDKFSDEIEKMTEDKIKEIMTV